MTREELSRLQLEPLTDEAKAALEGPLAGIVWRNLIGGRTRWATPRNPAADGRHWIRWDASEFQEWRTGRPLVDATNRANLPRSIATLARRGLLERQPLPGSPDRPNAYLRLTPAAVRAFEAVAAGSGGDLLPIAVARAPGQRAARRSQGSFVTIPGLRRRGYGGVWKTLDETFLRAKASLLARAKAEADPARRARLEALAAEMDDAQKRLMK